MEEEIKTIINSYESKNISLDEAISRIKTLSGKDIDSYSLENYWSSQSIEDFVRTICMPPIDDWQSINDEKAIELIKEMQDNISDDAVLDRNSEALAKRYGKTAGDITEILFSDGTAEEIFAEIKTDTRIYL